MKRIVHLITSLEGGGTENFLDQIVSHSSAEFSHHVLYLKKDGVIGQRMRSRGISITRTPTSWHVLQILRRERPDILHTCLYSAHIIGRCIGRLAGVPQIVTSQRSIDIWQRPWQTWIDHMTLPLSDTVITNSTAATQLIEHRRGQRTRPRIVQIPNGIDIARLKSIDRTTARRQWGLPPEAVVGCSLMRLHKEKGADFIPDFASHLLTHWPQLHLIVGGVGPLEQSIKHKLAGTPFGNRIHWAGWVDDTAAILTASDFFWSLSREESFPQTLVEASALGLPWVAPDVGGVKDLLTSGAAGSIYPRLDITAAAQQVNRLINQLPAVTTLAQNARFKIQSDYSIERMVAEVYVVFDLV